MMSSRIERFMDYHVRPQPQSVFFQALLEFLFDQRVCVLKTELWETPRKFTNKAALVPPLSRKQPPHSYRRKGNL
jgi:hypothetical protein